MGTMADPREYLDRSVAELQVEMSQLSGSFTQLWESQSKYGDRLRSVEMELARSGSEVSQRLGTLERQMGAITQTLARIEASSFAPRPHGKDIASASHSQIHVSDSPVAVSDDSPVGFRGPNLLLASRESLLRKIALPVFEGHMPYGWLCRVERYFRVGQYTEAEKLELISLSLEGRVLNWFEGEMVDNPFTDWSQFKERMLARFAVSLDDVPVFNGRMPYGWICRMQRFFRQSQYAEEQKLGLVPLCLEGDALQWYEEELGKAAFMNWLNFQKRLLAHFAPDESNVHSEVMLTTEMVPAVIAEIELVQKVDSPVVEALHEKSGASVTCCINNVDSSEDKYLLPSLLANVIDFGAEVELSQHGTGISKPAHEYQLCAIMSHHQARLRMRKKKQKWSKAWRFKFKQRRHHNNMSRPALTLADGRNNKSSYYHFGFNVALEKKRQLLDFERNEFDIVQNELKHATEVFESVQDLPSAPNSTNDPAGIHDAAVVAHFTHRSDMEHTYAEQVLWSVQMTRSGLHIQPFCLTMLNALGVDWFGTTEKPLLLDNNGSNMSCVGDSLHYLVKTDSLEAYDSLRAICTPQSQHGERTICEELHGAKWNGSDESLKSQSVFIFDESFSGVARATLLVHQVEQFSIWVRLENLQSVNESFGHFFLLITAISESMMIYFREPTKPEAQQDIGLHLVRESVAQWTYTQSKRRSCAALTAETYFLVKASIADGVTGGRTVQPIGQTLQGKLLLHHSWLLQEHKQKQRKCVKTWMFKYKLGDKLILKGGSIDKLAT